MTKNNKTIKRNKTICNSWFLKMLVLIPGVFLPIKFISAAWYTNAWTFVSIIIGYVLQFFLYILVSFFWIWGKAFNFVFNGSLKITEFDVITTGWGLTRDVLNMFFVIALLIIAFATILRIESYQYKVLLPKLIYAALLVNFSRTIATVLVDFSNVLMKTLLGLSNGTISETFARVIFGKGVMQIAHTAAPNISDNSSPVTVYNLLLGYVVTMMLVLGMSMAILGLTIMMIVRSLVLMILIILSPVAFVLNILPVTAQYAKKWWDEFLKYVFYGPVAAFMVYLAVLLAKEVGTKISSSNKGEKWDLIGKPEQVNGLMTTEGIFSVMLVIGFLFMSILMIKALSPMAAGAAMGFYKRGGRLVGKASGWGARWAGTRLSRSAAKGKEGLIGGAIGVGAGAVAGLGGLMTGSTDRMRRAAKAGFGVGDYAALASPEVIRRANAARQQRLDERTFGKGAGFARNKMNTWFRDQDDTDYVKQQYRTEVAEEDKALLGRNPSLKHEQVRSEFKAIAGKRGEIAKKEALMRALFATGDPNELWRDMATDKDFQKLMHTSKFMDGVNNGNHYDPATGKAIKKFDKDGKITEEWQTAEDSKDGYSYYAAQDVFKKMFGDEHGVQLMADVSATAKRNGDFALDEGVQITSDGKARFASVTDQAKGASESLSKLDADSLNSVSRFTVAVEGYDAKGKANKKLKLQPGMKKFYQTRGPTTEGIKRLERKMKAKTQETLLAAKDDIVSEIKKLIKSGDKKIAKNMQDQYNMAAKNYEKVERISFPELPQSEPSK